MEKTKIYKTTHRPLRRILRGLPEYQIEKILDIIKLNGREREIITRFYIKHETVEEICEALSISTGSYHIASNKALRKIELSLPDIELKTL